MWAETNAPDTSIIEDSKNIFLFPIPSDSNEENYECHPNFTNLEGKNLLELSSVPNLSTDSSNQIIDIEDLPPYIANYENSSKILKVEMPSKLELFEKNAIITTLKITNGNKSKASELLGITRKTLQNKLAEYNITIQIEK